MNKLLPEMNQAVEFDKKVREKRPLIHHITNFVVMNFTANITLALGAQPIMAHAPQEVDEMQAFCSCLLVNIGTIDEPWIEGIMTAAKSATRYHKPIILDPVGAGATALRTKTALRILDESDVTVVRGNAGEILALSGDSSKIRGVDATAEAETSVQWACQFAKKRNIIVAMTGQTDVVTDGNDVIFVHNGHEMMSRVTGTGCGCSAAVASYVGAADPNQSLITAVIAALAIYGRAGEIAAQCAHGPGSFVPAFLDALFNSSTDIKPADLKISRGNC